MLMFHLKMCTRNTSKNVTNTILLWGVSVLKWNFEDSFVLAASGESVHLGGTLNHKVWSHNSVQVFQGVIPTEVSGQQTPFWWESYSLIPLEEVLLHQRECGIHSWYFIIPKKDGHICPILNFKLYTDKLSLQNVDAETNHTFQWEREFVTIDLKDAYFHVFPSSQNLQVLCSSVQIVYSFSDLHTGW